MAYCKVPEEHPDKYLSMPGGLDGYWWETDSVICIPFVASDNEGDGAFSKWLNELEAKGKVVFFPTVISARLDRLLRKRGYVDALARISDEEREVYGQEYCDGLAKFTESERS